MNERIPGDPSVHVQGEEIRVRVSGEVLGCV